MISLTLPKWPQATGLPSASWNSTLPIWVPSSEVVTLSTKAAPASLRSSTKLSGTLSSVLNSSAMLASYHSE